MAWWEPPEKATVMPVPELPKVHGLGFRVWEGWNRLQTTEGIVVFTKPVLRQKRGKERKA